MIHTKIHPVQRFGQTPIVLVQGYIGTLLEPLQHFHHLPLLFAVRL